MATGVAVTLPVLRDRTVADLAALGQALAHAAERLGVPIGSPPPSALDRSRRTDLLMACHPVVTRRLLPAAHAGTPPPKPGP